MRIKKYKRISDTTHRFNKKSLMLWVGVGAFISFQIYLTIITSSSGALISQYEKEAQALAKENEKIQSQLIVATSLSHAQKYKDELGFEKATNIVYLSDQQFVAQLR